jgi:putative transposase
VIILSERRLDRVLCEYCFGYFNAARPHQEIEQCVPTARVLKGRTDPAGVIAMPVLGGLHHDYRAAA